MTRILSANFFRLRHSKVFWLANALTLFGTAAVVLYAAISNASDYALDNIYFAGEPAVEFIAVAVTVLFVGTDYSDGTIRNKVAVGRVRAEIYAANTIAGIVIGVSLNASYLLGGLAGIPVLGAWKMPLSEVFSYMAVSMLYTVALSAIAALIGMLCSRKASAVVIAIFSTVLMAFAASRLYIVLCQPETQRGAAIVNGEFVLGEIEQNPRYVGGALRTVYEIALHTIPMGQSVMLSNLDIDNPLPDAAASAAVTICVSALGAAAFRKKDLS